MIRQPPRRLEHEEMDRSAPIIFRRTRISKRPTARRSSYRLSVEGLEGDTVDSLWSDSDLQQHSQVSRGASSDEGRSQGLRDKPCCDRDPVPQSDRERWKSVWLCVGGEAEEDSVVAREQSSLGPR